MSRASFRFLLCLDEVVDSFDMGDETNVADNGYLVVDIKYRTSLY